MFAWEQAARFSIDFGHKIWNTLLNFDEIQALAGMLRTKTPPFYISQSPDMPHSVHRTMLDFNISTYLCVPNVHGISSISIRTECVYSIQSIFIFIELKTEEKIAKGEWCVF